MTRLPILLLLFIGAAFNVNAVELPFAPQMEDPVSWTFEHEDLGEGEYLLKFIATLESGWFIYSQDIADGGPVPTSFTFKERKTWSRVDDKIEEVGKMIDGHDPVFDMQVKKYKDKVVFQTKVKSKKKTNRISGELEFMTCDDSKCLPPATEKFSFIVGKDKKVIVQKDKDAEALGAGASAAADGHETEVGKTVDLSAPQGLLEPVKWNYDWVEVADSTFEMRITATIDDGWYVYSQLNTDEGPRPTTFEFETEEGIEWLDDRMLEEGKLKSGIDPVFNVLVNKFGHKLTFKRRAKLTSADAKIAGNFEYMTCDDGKCLFPEPQYFEFTEKGYTAPGEIKGDVVEINLVKAFTDCGVGEAADSTKGKSLWAILLLGFLGGLAALLTPCVFPMIPLTVSFFTKQSGSKAKGLTNAIIYGLSIIVIYVSLGYFVTVAFGPDALNAMSTKPIFNLAFFVLFVVFAISFFGYFEITLPSWLINKSDSASEKGGLIGIFFMAFTLALVSFSCTGPIIGSLLVDAAINGETIGPVAGMFGFSLALALPFFLFALFPSWLTSLPKSGGWLNTVKVVLGFIELIFALKFLSNADLVPQWGLLKREVFLVIWIALLLGLAAYLFGLIKFPHDSPVKKLGLPRIGLGLTSIVMALYLVPGIFCQNLPLASGFPPPLFYSYGCHSDAELHGIQDYEEGIVQAVDANKPILVDFTGWACVNCRKMEENVWPEVADVIGDYTLVSLYVDQNTDLEEDRDAGVVVQVNGKKRQLHTVGNRWSYFQNKCFMTNTQPYYALVTPKGELLAQPVGYTPDVKTYHDWLQQGLDEYKSKYSGANPM